MIEIHIDDSELQKIGTKTKEWQKRLPAAFQKKMLQVVVMLMSYVKQKKLTGQVLKVKSGTLRRSISGKVEGSGRYTWGEVGTNVKYGVFWELGGTIPARTIRPKKMKALSFIWKGQKVVCKSVFQPSRKVTARPFLAPALKDKRDKIIEMVGNVPLEVISN